MNQMFDLDLIRSAEALQGLAEKCRQDMKQRWPNIDFDAEVWEINKLYGTVMLDVRFHKLIEDFADKDPSYVLAVRCLVARRAFENRIKMWSLAVGAWRLLHRQAIPLAALRRHHLRELEEEQVKEAKENPLSAKKNFQYLTQLSEMLDELARLKVIGHLAWGMSEKTKSAFRPLLRESRNSTKKHIDVLDRQVEALSDATTAMLLRDERLTAMDRSAIAVTNLLMCAPSRINEPLCMRITDRYTIDDYASRPNGADAGKVYQAHQLLLMKGSKGASWSGKPILNFMVGLSDACWDIILELGKRSRALVAHYEKTPDQLYLPPELEHLRGTEVSKASLWKITNLTDREPTPSEYHATRGGVWGTMIKCQNGAASAAMLIDNPRTYTSHGRKSRYKKIPAVTWQTAETYLLDRVRERMEAMRRVTSVNPFSGPLSQMLVLVDTGRTPYLPQAWDTSSLRVRLKSSPLRAKRNLEESVFLKLGLQMTQNGELVDCYIEPHDTRRWLTTQALNARERLSDVLINKWANRIDISQLAAYDLRTAEQKANQIEVPVPQELESITTGLRALEGIENEYGLRTDIAIAQGDALALTSVDAVMQATENRPVARSGNQIIILYPNRFGVCLHQHHETPCRAYSACSQGCNEQLTVKGHLPTNEEWRKQEELNNRGIINQLQALITARSRGVADDPAMLDAHLLTLVKGMNAQAMAEELIQRFHEVKDQIRDLHFRNELEAAFVAHGVVARLDDPSVPNGALIKYHNHSRHASPGYERAIEAQCGGREEMECQDALFHQKYPELAPRALGLEDQRSLLGSRDDDEDGEEDEDDDEQA
ncbi:hypothetical protein K788_0001887 (plasmid) [Paraburkholderia caribensis MBA4]|uniref:Uncharacterized protein n=1 Tax=Paraburkholderia caribensis MBA4 TaxID=1323664 RepID=A0A0P0RQP5_9BURK|nr:hypothetical protein [Paraburkholderia caribensis]ALL71298.1 hypothetical protein K788_0001887 [Paraburkholderia caribensis MBA4]